MDYISFELIKKRREELGLTQAQLASVLNVSEKTVSKWETKRGFPDISLLPSIADALQLSMQELMSGKRVENANRHANMLKTKFYVCPICKNTICAFGEAEIVCCGITLVPEIAEETHGIVTVTKDELIVKINSPMTKDDYVSFVAYVSSDSVEIRKLYPEGASETTFLKRGHGLVYYFDVKNGLFFEKV